MSPTDLAETAGVRLVQLMWGGGYDPTWDTVKERFSRLWGMGDPEDERKVARLLQAGVKALGDKGEPSRYEKPRRAVSPRELAAHWAESVTEAMKAGRFTADELRGVLDEFRVPAELGGELMTVHFEFVPLYARWHTLTAQKNDLRQGNLVRSREIDREWHGGQAQRVQERDEVIADQIKRRSEASKAFGAARSEAKTAANKTAVAERRLAAGRGSQEELDRAREAQRRAEQATVDAKAELDRVDAQIKEEKEQRSLKLSAPNRERAANRDRADAFEAAANAEIAAIELRCEALREWHRRLLLEAARLNNHYLQERHAEQARRANASIEAAHRKNMEIAREQAEKAGLDRGLALAGLDFELPTVPAVPSPDPVQPEVEEAVRELRGRYAPRRAEEFDRERPESPTIGFSLPAQEEGSVNPEPAEEPDADDVPLSPPPIGFSFPPPTP